MSMFCANRSRKCDRVKRSAIPAVSFSVALLRPKGTKWPNTAMAATGRGAAGAPATPGDEAGPGNPVVGPGSPVAGPVNPAVAPGSPVVVRSGDPAISAGHRAALDRSATVVPSSVATTTVVRDPPGTVTVARDPSGTTTAPRDPSGTTTARRGLRGTSTGRRGLRGTSTGRRGLRGTTTGRRDPRDLPARTPTRGTTTRRCPRGSSPSSWLPKCAAN